MSPGEDLEYAKEEFRRRKSAFVIVKAREILTESKERGVAPFFHAVTSLHGLKGASLADRIVGKAVAFLCVYAGISSVYTPVVSNPAIAVLRDYSIHVEAGDTVPMILDRTQNGQCPIEKLIFDCKTPEEAYFILKEKLGGY